MAIVTWRKRNPSELAALRGGMDEWFENFFRGLDRPLSLLEHRAWPAIDVAEREDSDPGPGGGPRHEAGGD